ncbi:MAG: hypothetical protein ACYS30_17120 [Planctomycetota bacterium]|jgi:hypothetical protein
MFDGLWTVEFKTEFDFGMGVLVLLKNGQVLGGDFGYYYSGQITMNEGQITGGEVSVVRFNPNAASVFGDLDSFIVLFKTGTINETSFSAEATVKGAEHLSIVINGKKKVDIDEAS